MPSEQAKYGRYVEWASKAIAEAITRRTPMPSDAMRIVRAVRDAMDQHEWEAPAMEAAAAAIERAIADAVAEREARRDDALGEALYGLSARLLLSGFLDNAENHASYERVVKAFGSPFIERGDHKERADG